MPDKTANDLIHTNAEYEKLKGEGPDDGTPRETPQGQGPGRRGYDKQIFAEWTTEELETHAARMNLAVPQGADREQIIALLDAHDATLSRAGG